MQSHVADYDEILPHVFLGEVTHYVLSDVPQRGQLVCHLNDALREGQEETRNLIAVSFIENLDSREELERALMMFRQKHCVRSSVVNASSKSVVGLNGRKDDKTLTNLFSQNNLQNKKP